MIHRRVCARVDTGLGRNESANAELKPNTYIILSKTDYCHLWCFSYSWAPLGMYVFTTVCVWRMCLSPHRQTRWPRLHPNTDWEMSFGGGRQSCPAPQSTDWCLPVCLRLSTCRSSPVGCLPSHHFWISIHLSRCSHHWAVFPLMSSRQFAHLSPSITFAYILLCQSAPQQTILDLFVFRAKNPNLNKTVCFGCMLSLSENLCCFDLSGFDKNNFLLGNLDEKYMVSQPPDEVCLILCVVSCGIVLERCDLKASDTVWDRVRFVSK